MKDSHFNNSENIFGGIPVIEATQCDQDLYFEKSFIVAGEKLQAPKIHANYDLTIIGNLEAEEIEIHGDLNIIGNITATNIFCAGTLMCKGSVEAENIEANQILVNYIDCYRVNCTGNVIIQNAMNIRESMKATGCVLVGEGIIGNGQFSTPKNAAVVDYFDFDGEVYGKVLELRSGRLFGEDSEQGGKSGITGTADTLPDMSVEQIAEELFVAINKELQEAGNVNEEKLTEYIKKISSFNWKFFADWNRVFQNLVEISRSDEVENLRDYLYFVMSKKIFPSEIIADTCEQAVNKFLSSVDRKNADIPFHARDAEDLAFCLKIVFSCDKELKIDKDVILDCIFQSVGIKYKTVQNFLG